MKIEHIAIWAKDVEKLRTFYEKYFHVKSSDKYINSAKKFSSYFLSRVGWAVPTLIKTKKGYYEMDKRFIAKDYIIITLITSLWVHASQLFRFFAYVRSELQSYLSAVPNVAPMDELGILLVWGLWDTLLTALYIFLFWLCAQVFGNNRKSI